jgi:hypothetical protein
VPGRVHRDEALRRVEQLLRHRLEDDALAGQEVVVALGDLDEVGVADDRPEALVVRVLEQAVLDRAVPGDRAARGAARRSTRSRSAAVLDQNSSDDRSAGS